MTEYRDGDVVACVAGQSSIDETARRVSCGRSSPDDLLHLRFIQYFSGIRRQAGPHRRVRAHHRLTYDRLIDHAFRRVETCDDLAHRQLSSKSATGASAGTIADNCPSWRDLVPVLVVRTRPCSRGAPEVNPRREPPRVGPASRGKTPGSASPAEQPHG